MSIVRVGATKQYSDNWTNIFGGGKSRSTTKSKPAAPKTKSAKKKSAPKKAAAKTAKKKGRGGK
jgi:hypothetical protein